LLLIEQFPRRMPLGPERSQKSGTAPGRAALLGSGTTDRVRGDGVKSFGICYIDTKSRGTAGIWLSDFEDEQGQVDS
jgi:hypothetical protein